MYSPQQDSENSSDDNESNYNYKSNYNYNLNSNDINSTNSDNETLTFNTYNLNNVEITVEEVEDILAKYGIHQNITNLNLYRRAFVHKSYTKKPNYINEAENIILSENSENAIELKTKSNERLEFLGDGILEAVIKFYLYRRFPREDEGFMTEKKIALVKNEHIGQLAFNLKLNKWFVISKHAEEKNIRNNLKKLGCLFEAFIAAIFLDFNKININDEEGWFHNVFQSGPGFQFCQIFIESVIETHVNWDKLISLDDNYKNQFQVKIQKVFKVTPTYIQLDYDPDIGYTTGVYLRINKHHEEYESALIYKKSKYACKIINSFEIIQEYILNHDSIYILFAKSTHKIKKKSEQLACQYALNII